MTDAAKKARREYARRWRAKNAEHVKEYNKRWRDANRDKIEVATARYWERKAQEMSS